MAELAVCADFGSTYTKALLVDLGTGRLLGTAEHRTTIATDVLEGYAACLAELAATDPRAADPAATVALACSSAGGGLRIAVVGNEELVTAEAGRRVALSSGGRVVAVHAAADGGSLALPADADVVLLTGGTDGGNREVVVRAARDLLAGGWSGPVVVAGNRDAREEVEELLTGRMPVMPADNVVPRIGVLAPASARAAIRSVFLRHVIGGKGLSSGPGFAAMVRGATPDVVLTGVEVLAGLVGDVVVVDVGGATTDVHSVVRLDPDTTRTDDGLAREVVAPTPVTRTVEADLGMRWSAVSTAEAAGLGPELRRAAVRRHASPAYLPDTDAERDADEALARAAAGLAVRRHCGRSRVVVSPEGRVVERSGVDLREVDLVVGSGGVLRHGRRGVAGRVLGPALAPDADWQLPARAPVVVDADYVLAGVGLLAGDHPEAARALAATLAARAL